MLEKLRNRKKPILGTIVGAIVFAVLVAIGLDEKTAGAISLAVSGFVVERVGPLFGDPVETPELDGSTLRVKNSRGRRR